MALYIKGPRAKMASKSGATSGGFELEGVVVDGGRQRTCFATAADGGGFTLDCTWSEACDGGPGFVGELDCGVTCSGTLLLRE